MGAVQAPDGVIILCLLVIVALIAAVVRDVRIPYAVALALAFLPVLLFDGAYSLALMARRP
jgi:NhaP-type Na+/H+ or K+/H+ antiporter